MLRLVPSSPLPRHPIVVRFGRIGDTVLLAPLLRLLHRRYGNPCRLVASGRWPQELYGSHPDVDQVWSLRRRHRPLLLSPERWRLLWRLRRSADDPIFVAEVEPQPLAKIRQLFALAQVAPERCVFLTDLPSYDDEHWIDRLLRLGAAAPPAHAAPQAVAETRPQLAPTAVEIADAREWLRARGCTAQPLILLQPGNRRTMRWKHRGSHSDDDKSWPDTHWLALTAALSRQLPQAQLLLCGAPEERRYLESLRRRSAAVRVAVAADDLPLRRLLALTTLAAGMISIDTGPAHVAAAGNCPLVVLFGAASPTTWLPRSADGAAVVALGGPACGGHVARISVDSVLAAAQQVFLPAPSIAAACERACG